MTIGEYQRDLATTQLHYSHEFGSESRHVADRMDYAGPRHSVVKRSHSSHMFDPQPSRPSNKAGYDPQLSKVMDVIHCHEQRHGGPQDNYGRDISATVPLVKSEISDIALEECTNNRPQLQTLQEPLQEYVVANEIRALVAEIRRERQAREDKDAALKDFIQKEVVSMLPAAKLLCKYTAGKAPPEKKPTLDSDRKFRDYDSSSSGMENMSDEYSTPDVASEDGDGSDDKYRGKCHHRGRLANGVRHQQWHRRRSPPDPKMQTFQGEPSKWRAFIYQFRGMAKQCHWTQRQRRDKMLECLKEKAIEYVSNLPTSIRCDYKI